MKLCTRKNHLMPKSEFWKNNSVKDGLYAFCINCATEVKAEWNELNKEYILENRKQYYKENKENENKTSFQYKLNNRGRCNAIQAKRRAALLQATPKWLTKEHLKEIQWYYDTAKDLQWLSEDKLTIDHIMPLLGENSCGLHVPWNLQILPMKQNSSKKNKI
jgi:hypothetical protein